MKKKRYSKAIVVLLLTTILLLSLLGCGILEANSFFDNGFYSSYYDSLINATGEFGTGSTALSGKEKNRKKQDFSQAKSATVMIYLNGSDLEESYRAATEDILEIINADLSENINVIIQTGGTNRWHVDGISSERAQRFYVDNHKLYLVEDDIGQPDITEPKTLSDFIKFCNENYPADRNILILWDHGGGPVEGFGYDSIVADGDSMTLDEMQTALSEGDVYFDFIGFDACLMASIETLAALCDFADYMIFSQDFESSYGWDYSGWLELFSKNVTMDTKALAKTIIDDFVSSSEKHGLSGILTLCDTNKSKELYEAWSDFLFQHGTQLKDRVIQTKFHSTNRAKKKGMFDDLLSFFLGEEESLEDYSLFDVFDVADELNTKKSGELKEAVKEAVVYSSSTIDDAGFCGLNVAIPFSDLALYEVMDSVYSNSGFSQEYLEHMRFLANG